MAGAQRPGRFRPGELDADDLGPGAEAELLGTARELEWLAASADVGPGADFADRVMAAVSREPAPRPVAAALGAARRRSPLAALSALGDLWRVAFTGGRPFVVRLPAMALVALLLVGSLGVGALGAGALAALVGRTPDATPALVSSSPAVTSPPEPAASPSPSASPSARESTKPSQGPESSESPTSPGTPEPIGIPTMTPGPTEGDTAHPTGTPRPTEQSSQAPGSPESPGPTETPEATSGPS